MTEPFDLWLNHSTTHSIAWKVCPAHACMHTCEKVSVLDASIGSLPGTPFLVCSATHLFLKCIQQKFETDLFSSLRTSLQQLPRMLVYSAWETRRWEIPEILYHNIIKLLYQTVILQFTSYNYTIILTNMYNNVLFADVADHIIGWATERTEIQNW